MKNIKAIIFTAMAAATLGLTAPQAAKAGGIYRNNNGGGAVIINRNGRFYGPRGNNYGPPYSADADLSKAHRYLCTWLLRSCCLRPLLMIHSSFHWHQSD